MPLDFQHRSLKGKIAELVFEQMFKAAGEFAILRSGYEYVFPQLAQYQENAIFEGALEDIRSMPDFILYSNESKGLSVYLVEVKYQHKIDQDEIVKISDKILKKWDHAYLFVAAPEGFFFSPCHTIMNTGGIEKLKETWVPQSIQEEYRQLLNEFEP